MKNINNFLSQMALYNRSMEGPHILLGPYCPTINMGILWNNMDVKTTRNIGLFERSSIVSLTHKSRFS